MGGVSTLSGKHAYAAATAQRRPMPVRPASLGECMVRLAPPGHGRIEFAKMLEVDVGRGEFNVAYACARLGLRAGLVSKLPDSPLARPTGRCSKARAATRPKPASKK